MIETKHTGGIVWETSYFLLDYLLLLLLEPQPQNDPNHDLKMSPPTTIPTKSHSLGHVLEIGSGCGLIGLGLATAAAVAACHQYCHDHPIIQSMVATEISPVLQNLQYNINQQNQKNSTIMSHPNTNPNRFLVHCSELDWMNYHDDFQRFNQILKPHSYNTIIGTDVLFAPSLVIPLLQTLQYAIYRPNRNNNTINNSHDHHDLITSSTIYICDQIRCVKSYQLFWQEAQNYGFHIEDITHTEVYNQYPMLTWGKELEFHILRLTLSLNDL
jgi:Lysine methyltransferase